MKKKLSLLTALLFSLLLTASACVSSTFPNTDKQFRAFTAELFRQEVSSSTITLHYTVQNPEEYGIKHTPVSLGAYTTDTSAISAATENCLALLHKFNYKNLSHQNKLTYQVLEYYLKTSLEGVPFTLYEEPLSPLTGIQSQLPVLLSEYPFYSEDDVKTYLSLLEEFPAYFDSLIRFEQEKSKAGLFMPSYNASSIIEECNSFTSMGDSHYLFSSFQEKIAEMKTLTEKQKSDYFSHHKTLMDSCVFPSYNKLSAALLALKDTGKNNNGLCYYPDGKAYYEFLVKRDTGTDRSIRQLQELTKSYIAQDLTALQQLLPSTSSSDNPEDTDPSAILEHLREKTNASFPPLPDVDVEVKYVQPEMEEYLSPAFYMVPAIDNTSENIIYINEGHLPDNLTLFTTLAHEGYPGHLYQNVYYASTKPDPLRSLLDFGGYTEGWATYVEMISYYLSPLPREQAALKQHNSSVILGLYALADMGIHYDGWSLAETTSFFRQFGITDSKTIEEIYELIIADPGNYLKYYIGYLEFLELKKDAIKDWGDEFSQIEFHKTVLDTGPAPFPVLKEEIRRK